MDIPLTTYRKLLGDTTRVIRHQRELAILKGETFNIFSILKMEYRENETHSAFLGELLNPKGSHRLGSIFLKCFLLQLDILEHIELATAKVELEKHIAKRNDQNVIGGRVDIFIKDDLGRTICIENKIHAADQNAQIARYCNYNSANNKVFYLTLEGEEPSKKSCGKKILDQDFFTISYKVEILEWLEQCQKEATQFPVLRETINQYAILIKKLTNQLSDHTMQQEVKDIIIANYKAARVIGSNIGKIELEYTELFVSEVVDLLKKELPESFTVKKSDNLKNSWTGISIFNRNWPTDVKVKLEGAPKIPWNASIYGIHCHKSKFNRVKINEQLANVSLVKTGFSETEHWPCYKRALNLSTPELRSRLFKTSERSILVKEVSEKLIEIAMFCEKPLSKLELQ
tara:strand:+ start:23929 stop:25131 length:1203 start_codon:yes stop_codon:yes gene_type:complete